MTEKTVKIIPAKEISSCAECDDYELLYPPNGDWCKKKDKKLENLKIPSWCPLKDAPQWKERLCFHCKQKAHITFHGDGEGQLKRGDLS